jgi:hypothetical protein
LCREGEDQIRVFSLDLVSPLFDDVILEIETAIKERGQG